MQEAQAAAASGTEAVTVGLHQAQASIPQLVKELHSNRELLQRHLRECQGWADRHQYTVKALRDQLPAELMYPNSHWAADQAPVQLGMQGDSTKHDAWTLPSHWSGTGCNVVRDIFQILECQAEFHSQNNSQMSFERVLPD